MQGLGTATSIGAASLRSRHLQRRRSPTERGMIRHTKFQAKQDNDRADQPFDLPVCQTENGAQRQRPQNRQRRTPGLATARCTRLRLPRRDCLIGEPDRQTATLTQTGLVSRPIGDLAPLPADIVATVLIQPERHGDIQSSGQGSLPPRTGLRRHRWIHAPRWRMRRSRTTMQPFLDVRAAVLNNTLQDYFRHRYRGFRPANANEPVSSAA